MHLTTLTIFTFVMVTVAIPHRRQTTEQSVQLIFHGGPVQYSWGLLANGTLQSTGNDLIVDTIDAPNYNALQNCQFITDNDKTLVGAFSSTGVPQITVGPPQPIRAVSCQGVCIPTFGDCFRDGQSLGTCCAGFCAANKCRSFSGSG
ncbi:hypothetical protein HGRIS_004222 [Hohenbuehelia grisea]|uniref:Uncharacterized protein n=1 Tax=Hohenbuehelia grisea TaxID=104357 RepID=A0ABR3JHY4_9AGAR